MKERSIHDDTERVSDSPVAGGAARSAPRETDPAAAEPREPRPISLLGTVAGRPHFAIVNHEVPRLWFLLVAGGTRVPGLVRPRRYRVTCEHASAVFTYFNVGPGVPVRVVGERLATPAGAPHPTP